MSDYKEERSFTVRLELVAAFPESYEGDEDGYAWHARFDQHVRPKIARAVIEAVLADGGWKVTPAPRGENESEVLALRVERVLDE